MRKKLHSVTAFDVILAIIMVLICFACVYPMWYILANSLAAPEIANQGPVAWWPKALSLDAYKVVFQNEYILSGFKITILRTVVATFTHVFFTSMVAYGMSRKDLIGKKLYMKIAMITMFFNGGLIPNFILMIKLKLYNTFWVYILPGMFGHFHELLPFYSGIADRECPVGWRIGIHGLLENCHAKCQAGHCNDWTVYGGLPLERLLPGRCLYSG